MFRSSKYTPNVDPTHMPPPMHGLPVWGQHLLPLYRGRLVACLVLVSQGLGSCPQSWVGPYHRHNNVLLASLNPGSNVDPPGRYQQHVVLSARLAPPIMSSSCCVVNMSAMAYIVGNHHIYTNIIPRSAHERQREQARQGASRHCFATF